MFRKGGRYVLSGAGEAAAAFYEIPVARKPEHEVYGIYDVNPRGTKSVEKRIYRGADAGLADNMSVWRLSRVNGDAAGMIAYRISGTVSPIIPQMAERVWKILT
jgi:hypothetical protein